MTKGNLSVTRGKFSFCDEFQSESRKRAGSFFSTMGASMTHTVFNGQPTLDDVYKTKKDYFKLNTCYHWFNISKQQPYFYKFMIGNASFRILYQFKDATWMSLVSHVKFTFWKLKSPILLHCSNLINFLIQSKIKCRRNCIDGILYLKFPRIDSFNMDITF